MSRGHPEGYAGAILVPVFVGLVLLLGGAADVPWWGWLIAAAMFGSSVHDLIRDT